jgi:hypothetical protein
LYFAQYTGQACRIELELGVQQWSTERLEHDHSWENSESSDFSFVVFFVANLFAICLYAKIELEIAKSGKCLYRL